MSFWPGCGNPDVLAASLLVDAVDLRESRQQGRDLAAREQPPVSVANLLAGLTGGAFSLPAQGLLDGVCGRGLSPAEIHAAPPGPLLRPSALAERMPRR